MARKKVLDSGIKLADKYLYTVSILRVEKNSFSLEDVKDMKSAKFVEDKTEVFIKDGVRFFKRLELVGAPKDWLDKNNNNV